MKKGLLMFPLKMGHFLLIWPYYEIFFCVCVIVQKVGMQIHIDIPHLKWQNVWPDPP